MSIVLWVDRMLGRGWEGQMFLHSTSLGQWGGACVQSCRVILSSSNSSLLLLPLRERRDNKNHLAGGCAAQA